MGKIKSMVYNGDTNMFAIVEYRTRIKHFKEITNALLCFYPTENINNYLKLIRIYKTFLNAETNVVTMIDFLYKARRGVDSVEDRFYPCGKSSRYITKLEYLNKTIGEFEILLTDNKYVHDKVKHCVNHYGVYHSPKDYIDVLHQRLTK